MSELITDWLQAIGTVGAVILALFLQVYLVWRQRPSAIVTFSNDGDDKVVFGGWDHCHYVELVVRVKVWGRGGGRRTATNTRVLLIGAANEGPGSSPLHLPDCFFKWSGPSFAEAVDIPSGAYRRLDLLRLRVEFDGDKDEAPRGRRDVDGAPILVPALNRPGNTVDTETTRWPPSGRNRLEPGETYHLHLAVSCDGGDHTAWCLRFTFETKGDPIPNRPASEWLNRPDGTSGKDIGEFVPNVEVKRIDFGKSPRRPQVGDESRLRSRRGQRGCTHAAQ